MFKQATFAIAGATAIAIGSAGAAEAITLGAIQAGGGSFNANGITYSNFTCELTTSSLGSELLLPNSCDEINVLGAFSGFNLAFQGPFSATNLGSSGTAFIDALIGFDVMFDDNSMIDSLGLAFNGAIQGTAIASVTETAFDMGGNIIGQLFVTNSPLGSDLQDPALETGDFNLLNPVSQLRVEKNILLQAGPGGSAQISLIGQNYESVAVPEPISALPLVALGAVAAGRTVLKKKALV
ncbi:MAG: hypothetical protein AAF892_13680 [Cyanobacteria bacterium P01_D01_bin.71]